MKKSLLILTAALTFGNMAAAQTSATASAPQVPALTDVPAGHWAKDAIDKLISRGIILGYPDGTYRGTQNLTRYEAAVIIARLLEQIQNGSTTVTDSETVTALQNAVQELAADLAALGVRVTDLEENAVSKDDFARLEERVNGIGAANGDPEALAGIQAQIDELTARADEYDALRADVDDNASSIAALNDLTVLLNQDILDLQDRVTGIDAALVDVDTRITGIDTRVTKLENAPKFTVIGGFDGSYGRLGLVQGTTDFDVDRLTAGTPMSSANGGFADGSVKTPDTAKSYNTGSLTFGVKASQLGTIGGAVTVNDAYLNFGTTNVWDINAGKVGVTLDSAGASGTLAGQKFSAAYSAYNSNFKFQDYLFNNSTANSTRRGIVFNVAATSLPGAPDLTVVLGNTNSQYMTNQAIPAATTTVPNPVAPAANYYGVRMAYKPTYGTFGVSAAMVEGVRSAVGTDFNMNYGPVNLKGEGVLSIPNGYGNIGLGVFPDFQKAADAAGYVEARANLDMISFGVNARAVNPAFARVNGKGTDAFDSTPGNAGMMDTGTMPYAAGQVGYGAALGTNLGPVALGAYVDSYTNWLGGDRKTGFGVKAGGKLGALELVAYYNSLTRDGKADNGAVIATGYATDNAYLTSSYNTNAAGMGIANVPMAMTSTVGVQLSHKGTADNALVKGLNFTIGDAYFYDTATNSLYVYGDYTNTLGGFTVNPMFRYRLVTDASDAAAYAAAPTAANAAIAGSSNFNTIKYGVKLASPVLTSVPFQPSLYANFANRISNVGTGMGIAANGTTTTELLGQVGIGFNNFIVDGVSAKVGYSYYQGFGVTPIATGADNQAFNASDDRIYGTRDLVTGGATKLDGITTQVAWNGLSANYGVFRYYDLKNPAPNGAPTSVAQGFKVGYNFKF